MNKIKRALISVWDKNGIVELAEFLYKNNIQIISTGGTKKVIEKSGVPVISVSDIIEQKEIMDGRVKTLHPNLFGGILADRSNNQHILDLKSINALEIDMVVINLYPFKSEAVDKKMDLEKAIEFIDIGGPSMLRAAAKNFKNVIPLCASRQYVDFMNFYNKNNGIFSVDKRIEFAKEVFTLTMKYDYLINNYFLQNLNHKTKDLLSDDLLLNMSKQQDLRYGENPHQKSAFYIPNNANNFWKKLQGKELSYNNYFDMESAISIVYEFDNISCAIIKHSNPCGFGFGETNLEAYENAVSTDSVSYFGGIVAFNTEVDQDEAILMSKVFLECIVAPSFTSDAIAILGNKKNLRLISCSKDALLSNTNNLIIKSVFNGFLYQNKDTFLNNINDCEVVTKRKPTEDDFKALLIGWKIVKSVKSNAIVISNKEKTLGIGAGQMSRVDSVKIAIRKSKENNLNLDGSIIASDAFFPFPDSIELAAKEGVIGVIQPGGSIKDSEVIKMANKLNIFMIFTKERHFLH
tara:strand:+ start:4135 stop:5694 length:1560 start_codon:yes stop_codon:yes gene_type:complete